jgi:hypothetical protein
LQLALKNILRWKNSQVLRNVYADCVKLQDLPGAGAGAKDDSKWLAFSVFALVLGQPTKVEFHLPLVLWPEASLLQLNSDQPLEFPVIEEQVDVEVFSVELNALLASDEEKPAPSSSRNISNSRRIASSKSRSM